MKRRILILQGHPDPAGGHFGHALSDAYAAAAGAAGHEIRRVEIARLKFPVLRTRAEWEGKPPLELARTQAAIAWADHIVLFFPLWLGTMPALVKAFLEQVLRPGFALETKGCRWVRKLRGKSARIVVTMGMPALVYRGFFLSHGVRGMERNILKFCGISPVKDTFIGLVEGGAGHRRRALEKMGVLGARGG